MFARDSAFFPDLILTGYYVSFRSKKGGKEKEKKSIKNATSQNGGR